jgi:hypothetical protein
MSIVQADFADDAAAPAVLATVSSMDADKRLPRADAVALADCERIIQRDLRAYVEIGAALQCIRDNRLYRQDYGTFAEYVDDRWDMGRRHAYQLIEASEITHALCAIVHKDELPENEAQARALSGLEPEQAATVLRKARSSRGKVTAKAIQQARTLVAVRARRQEPTADLGLGAHVGPKPLAAVDTLPTAGDVAADEQVVGGAITDPRRDGIRGPDISECSVESRCHSDEDTSPPNEMLEQIAAHVVTLLGNVIELQDEVESSWPSPRCTASPTADYERAQRSCIREHIAQARQILDQISHAVGGSVQQD